MFAKRFYIIILLCAVSVGALRAQESKPVIDARLTPDSIAIGDQFRMEVTVDKDIVQIVEFPAFENGKLGGEIEILSESGVDTLSRDGRRVKLRKNYLLTIFDEGIYKIGKFPALYVDKNIVDTIWSRDSMELMVSTFAIDTTTQTIYDIKPQTQTPVVFDEFAGYLFMGYIIAQLIAILVWLIVRRSRRKNSNERPELKLPPHVVAIIGLEELKNQKLWQSNKHKLYYTTLTDIVRTYLEGRYRINAMEMTSDEILDALKDTGLTVKNYEELRSLLKSSDLVKFAKLTPTPEENEGAFVNAYYFVEETKPSLIEEPKKDVE